MNRLQEFADYHFAMYEMGDIDPSYPMLLYVCDRYELNMEQRYWLAFLYAATYCAPSVFYIYNEFPDYENVDVDRLQRWWVANKDKVIFQSDRLWIRSRDQFVPMFVSYKEHIGNLAQENRFENLQGYSEEQTYDNAYKYFSSVKYFGRFSMFLYLEAVYVVTGFPMQPSGIDWRNAESSRNGLCFALGMDDLLRGHEYGDEPLPADVFAKLDTQYQQVLDYLRKLRPDARVDAWNVETSLCAYKKWKRGKRYPGYYIDRQYKEITKMQENVVNGVDWSVLWDFRLASFSLDVLAEYGANNALQS